MKFNQFIVSTNPATGRPYGRRTDSGYWVDPRAIVIRHDKLENSRVMSQAEVEAHVTWLAGNIALNGLKEPLVIDFEDDTIFLVAGHCRLTALLKNIAAGITHDYVRCITEDKDMSAETKAADQWIRNKGLGFSHLDLGVYCTRMKTVFGWSDEKIASHNGVNVQTIENIFRLYSAPAELKEIVANDNLSATNAENLIREEGKTKAAVIAAEAVALAKAEGKQKATARHIQAVKTKAPVAPITRSRKKDEVPFNPSDRKRILEAMAEALNALNKRDTAGAKQILECVLENYGEVAA